MKNHMIVNNLAVLRIFTLALFSVLLAANLWGQTLPTEPGNVNTPGSEQNPYLISSTTDWNTFASDVNTGYNYSGKIVKLTASITLGSDGETPTNGTMVGTSEHPFCGTFDGNTKTLTFNYTVNTPQYTAPFRYTQGATIKNLTVAGDIETENHYVGGLIGVNSGSSTVQNVNVGITLINNDNSIEYIGGFAIDGSSITFDHCVFNGIIKGYDNSAGFCVSVNSTTSLNSCIFDPQAYSFSYVYGDNFAIGISDSQIIDCYYTLAEGYYDSNHGILAYKSAPVDMITSILTINTTTINTTTIYVPVEVSFDGLQDSYAYTGSDIDVEYNVYFDGDMVFSPDSYTAAISPATVHDMGTYTLTISGNNSADYYGSYSKSFYVGIAGSGTEDNPYILANDGDWSMFANEAYHDTYWASGTYVDLNANISVSEMVGTSQNPFCGIFNGNNKTITFNYTENTPANTAPFRYTNGATIKKLTVNGNITTNNNGAAGLIGNNTGSTTVQDVKVSSNINGKQNCGGFAIDGTGVSFTRCVYDGQIIAETNSGGFCGTGDNSTALGNCIFKPVSGSAISGGYLFANTTDITNCYYTDRLNLTSQGTEAWTSVPEQKIGHKVTVLNTTVYDQIINVTIGGVEDYYPYTGEAITITPTLDFAPALSSDNYISAYTRNGETVENIVDMGTYVYTVTGVEANNYSGSVSKSFVVGFSGVGTSDNPYIIANAADWNSFATIVNNGYNYSDEFLKLNADIEVSNIVVGSEGRRFMGTLDGDWYTLTFTCGSLETPFNNDGCAPFGYIEDATVKNLTVHGSIVSQKKYAGGIAGFTYGTNNIINCTSSIEIDCTKKTSNSGDCTFGGFVGQLNTGVINFENCMFDGRIFDSKATKKAQKCAGFVGWASNNTQGTYKVHYTNCTMAGTIDIKENSSNFHRNTAAVYTLNKPIYYITDYNHDVKPGPKGNEAPGSLPADSISRKYPVETPSHYVPGVVISNFSAAYQWTGNPIDINTTVSYFGTKLIKGTDYSISYKKDNGGGYVSVDNMIDVGDYEVTFTGNNNYVGSCVKYTKVINLASWSDLKEALAAESGEITLVKDYKDDAIDGPLVINGTITLNLNGFTLDRGLTSPDMEGTGQVIRVAEGASLIINGPGTITGGYSKALNSVQDGEFNDGGGICNWGDLTLNNVIITGNKCIKYNEGSKEFTARGGGVYNGPGSSFTMIGGSIKNNESRGGGGGVHGNKTESFNMTNVDISSNVCEDKGGGVRITLGNGKTANITNCDIRNNQLTTKDVSDGGGIYLEGGGTLNLTNCKINGNQSTKRGGGFYAVAGTTIATNCSFNDNLSYDYDYSGNDNFGGGICLHSDNNQNRSKLTLDGGIVDANQCRDNGGGIYVYAGATLKLKGNVQIFGNHKVTIGGKDGRDSSVDNNLYIADNTENGVIYIEGNLGESFIGVMKSHGNGDDNGIITSGLDGNGKLSNFTSDESEYHVFPKHIEEKLEAMLGIPSEFPEETGDITISTATVLDKPALGVTSITFSGDGCLHVEGDGYINTTFTNANNQDLLVIENGGQVVLASGEPQAQATFRKDIEDALSYSNENWYLISSAVKEPNILSATNIITANSTGFPTYDLYRLNEYKDLQWENYRNEEYTESFTTMENGRGYLYRNYYDYSIIIRGTLNSGDVEYDLSYNTTTESGQVNPVPGFNLIGNPYSHNIYKGADNAAIPNGSLLENKYLVLNTDGTWTVTDDGTAILPMTGIIVQARSASKLTMADSEDGYVAPPTPGDKNTNKNIWFTVRDNEFSDVTCVEFTEGRGLNKISHPNEKAPMLYIRHNGEDFASVDMSRNTKEINLCFKAMTMGRYTLSVNPQGDYGYLHLIDKICGEDIDLSVEHEYSFIGLPSDAADRFIVRLEAISDGDDDGFAFQNGSEIVVRGSGELQVFDIMGRMVATQYIDGVGRWCATSVQTGVYIMRLNDKTQKIIVR